MSNLVKCSLKWTCAATPVLLKSWQEEGDQVLQCYEGAWRGTSDNYLAVKLESPHVAGWELAWTCAFTDQIRESWSNNGYKFIRCNEPGWGEGYETEDNYFAIRVFPKNNEKFIIDLDWKFATTEADRQLWSLNGFSYVQCEEGGIPRAPAGASSDNYLAMRISVV
jgi:hypothetical protein